jgi:hypothetical protein
VLKFQDCHVLPEVLHVHADQQEIINLMSDFFGQDCWHSPPTEGSHHKENKGEILFELPAHYI